MLCTTFASPRDNTDVVLTLLDSSIPLAQCMRLQVGNRFWFVDRFDVVDTYFESEEIFDKVHDLANLRPLWRGHVMC